MSHKFWQWHHLILKKQTPSFNLVYRGICYPSGMGTSKNLPLIAIELQQYIEHTQYLYMK